MKHKHKPKLSHPEGCDQAAELTRLRMWIDRVRTRPSRVGLCDLLTTFIDLDAIRYVHAKLPDRMVEGFTLAAKASVVNRVVGVPPIDDRVNAGLMLALSEQMLLVDTGFAKGEPDLIFKSLIYDPRG